MSHLLTFGFVLLANYLVPYVLSVDIEEFLAKRELLLEEESKRILGGGLTLNRDEQLVNTMLMDAKALEYDKSVADLKFPASTHFFLSKPTMLQSEVFKFIRQMPKGKTF